MKLNVAAWPGVLAVLVCTGSAFAQVGQLRVSLLPKVSLGGRVAEREPLENALAAALAAKGARIVDLAQATLAERLAWSDRVQAGQLPEGANLFFTDALFSSQLGCWQSAAQLEGTSLISLQCTLNTKVLRADSGDIVFTNTQSLTGHGLTPETALDVLIRTRLGELLDPLATRALAEVQSSESWSLDLVVSELADPALARHFAGVLERLPGVRSARMAMSRDGLVKYLIAGSGEQELAGFTAALESNRELAMSLLYQGPRSLVARFDLARALPRPVMVMGVVKRVEAAPSELALFRAGLSLLPYLEPAHSSPVLADVGAEPAALERVTQRARKLAVPLILELTLIEEKARWVASAALIEVASKRSLLQGMSSNAAPEGALSEALQSLDKQYRGGLGKPALQSRLGIGSHVSPAPSDGVVVDAFRLVQRDGQSVASLKLHNLGTAVASAVSARVRSERQLLAQLALAPISAGSALEHEIPLQSVPQGGPPELRLEVDYQLGDQRRQVASQLLAGAVQEPAPVWEGMPAAYHEMVRTARRHYDAGDWQEARRLFLSVYALAPNARVACALGFVELDLRNLEAARKYLAESFDSQVRPLSTEQRSEVARALRRIAELGAGEPRAVTR